jgi:hypothetical protein
MVAEWERFQGEDPEGLVGFLAACGKREAIAALGKGLRSRPLAVRLAVVSAFGPGGNWSISSTGPGGSIGPGEPGPLPAAVAEEVEKLLVESLDDTEEREGLSGSWEGKSFSDPRVCDIAGHVLSQRWKGKYESDLSAPLKARDRQRFQDMNVWRKEQKLPLLSLPQPRAIPPVPKEKIEPLLDALRQARPKAKIEETLNAIAELGLPALAPTHQLLTELPKDHPARAEVEGLAKWLSRIVAEVTVAEGPVKPDAELANLLKDAKGKPLTSQMLVEILHRVAWQRPSGSTGIRLRAIRDDDLTGVTLSVELLTTRSSRDGTQPGWGQSERVEVAGKHVLTGGSGFWSNDYAREPNAYQGFTKAADEALAAPPDHPFLISHTLVVKE